MLSRPTAMGLHGAMATPHYLGTSAGLRVLQDGGNALDACVAACAVLGVVSPQECGIGGDLFLLIRPAGETKVTVLNASGTAGSRATPELIRAAGHPKVPDKGPLSVVTPGCVAGWHTALERFGTRGLDALLQPAITLAADGFPVSRRLTRAIRSGLPQLNDAARQIFAPAGAPPQPGDILRQPALAQTLRRIAKEGLRVMYGGAAGQAIGRFLESEGGHHTPEDLASYACFWADPAETTFRGFSVLVPPPNSQGVLHLMALSLLEQLDLGEPPGPSALHLQVEAMKLAYAEVQARIADPEHCNLELARVLSQEYAAATRQRLDPTRASPRPAPARAGDTVYLCAADRDGNAVSMIQSLRQGFGSGLMVPELGVMLNNRARDFGLADGDPNQIAPGKRPRHTLSPGMALRDGQPAVVYGTRGGDTQPFTMLQLSTNVLAFGMDPQEALDLPRWSVEPAPRGPGYGKLALESRFPTETVAGIQALGHETVLIDAFDDVCGTASMIQIDAARGIFLAGADPRGDGLALAY